MKKLLALIFIGLLVFIFIYRQRVFLRDPLATVTRDGVNQSGAHVLINYTNDILLDDTDAGKHRIYLVQNWNKVAGFPSVPLKCFTAMACMTDADQATATPIPVGTRGKRSAFEGVTMTNKHIEFVDEDGALVAVTLR